MQKWRFPYLSSLSFKAKLIAGFGSVILLLSAGILFTLLKSNFVRQLSQDVTDRHQPVTILALDMVTDVHHASGRLQEFLLTGDEQRFRDYTLSLDHLKNDLMVMQSNQITLNDPALLREIETSREFINRISTYANEIRTLRHDYEKNHPVINYAAQHLNPLALEFLGSTTNLISELRNSDLPNKDKVEVISTISDLRHQWTQMMSYLRVAMATQSVTDLKNVNYYIDAHEQSISDLRSSDIDLGLTGIDGLIQTRDLYLSHLERVYQLIKEKHWRRDIEIMNHQVQPLFNNLERILGDRAQQQIYQTNQLGNLLNDALFDIEFGNTVAFFLALLAAILIAGVIVRTLCSQVRLLSDAASRVGDGDLSTRVRLNSRDELGELANRFNEMLANFQILLREKDDLAMELRSEKDNVEKASRAKTNFLSQMSHELRTPLNGILGFAQLLQLEKQIPEENRHYLDNIVSSGQHLLGLINELLDISRLETGTIDLHMQTIPLGDVIHECIHTVQALADSRNIKLDCACNLDYPIYGDKTRLVQVFLNLLSNAIKYNRDAGSVEIGCIDAEDNRLQISVTDTGQGINPDEAEFVFQPFKRLSENKHKIEGTGIGLSITKRLIELMNGKLGFESTPGKGTRFWVELPLGTPTGSDERHSTLREDTELPEQSNKREKTYTLVCIEDNKNNIKLIEGIVGQMQDIKFCAAHTGKSGIALVKQQKPDIILMDIGLPDMSGFEVFNLLSKDQETHHIPVIALSADALPESIMRGKQTGFCEYITKPFEISHLKSIIWNHIHSEGKDVSENS